VSFPCKNSFCFDIKKYTPAALLNKILNRFPLNLSIGKLCSPFSFKNGLTYILKGPLAPLVGEVFLVHL
jgi:hypothetical protein